jgi:RNA polymerase sigma-70 factor (ECF subfamily)
LVIWRKSVEFDIETDFQGWARKIAYYQTLAFLRDRKRDRHVFDEELLTQLASRPVDADEDERRVALRHCLGNISGDSLNLLQERYGRGKTITVIAQEHRKSEGAIKMVLMRIRQALVQCIEGQLATTQ